MEFKAFPDITRVDKLNMQITQKIHGSNSQIFIIPVDTDQIAAIRKGASGQIFKFIKAFFDNKEAVMGNPS